MVYESFKIVHMFKNVEYSSLTSDKSQMFEYFLNENKDFTEGKISFKEYTFDDFVAEYSYDELAKFINIEYRNKFGELYFCGTKYDTELSLVLELRKCKKLLKITVEC
jgi:hypothetical protein